MFRQNAELLHQRDINLLGQIMCFENLFIVRKGEIWLNNISWSLIRWQKTLIFNLQNSTGIPNLKSHQPWDFRIPIQGTRWCILLKFYLRKIMDSRELMGQHSVWVQIKNILKFSYLKGMPYVTLHNIVPILFEAMCKTWFLFWIHLKMNSWFCIKLNPQKCGK